MADGDLDIISSVHSESSELLLCTYKNDANDDLDAGGDADFRENKSKKGKITVSSWKEMQLYKFRYSKFLLLKRLQPKFLLLTLRQAKFLQLKLPQPNCHHYDL